MKEICFYHFYTVGTHLSTDVLGVKSQHHLSWEWPVLAGVVAQIANLYIGLLLHFAARRLLYRLANFNESAKALNMSGGKLALRPSSSSSPRVTSTIAQGERRGYQCRLHEGTAHGILLG